MTTLLHLLYLHPVLLRKVVTAEQHQPWEIPPCSSWVPFTFSEMQDAFSEMQDTFFEHQKKTCIGAGIARAKLRDTKWSQIGASVAPSPLFSRLTMGLVSHSASVLCTNVFGLFRTLVVVPLCPCRPVLFLLQGTDTSCTSETEGDGGSQGKASP